jgi:hypothetical protein
MDGLIAYALAKKYADAVGQQVLSAGFKVQVEQDRSILNSTGQEKIMYFLPKTVGSTNDGYDEFIYAQNAWEWVGHTDVDYTLTDQDKSDIANLVLSELPTTQGVQYGNTGN